MEHLTVSDGIHGDREPFAADSHLRTPTAWSSGSLEIAGELVILKIVDPWSLQPIVICVI